MITTHEEKLKDFSGDEELAAEYSDNKSCTKSDTGYHCSCYDKGIDCDLCGEVNKRELCS